MKHSVDAPNSYLDRCRGLLKKTTIFMIGFDLVGAT